MSRINTNVQSLVAARIFTNNQTKLGQAMQRLGSGLRINSGKDDPAGLIASEGMRSEITSINAALDNAKRADTMVSTAEGALNEVSTLLNDLQGLVTRSSSTGNLSSEEIAANQQQIDSILDSINRISTATEFAGKKLLDGSMEYTTTSVVAADLTDVRVNSARVGANAAASIPVTLTLTQSATASKAIYASTQTLSGVTTLQVAGKYGTEVFTFASHTTIANVATAINAAKTLTGVSAVASGANRLRFSATEFGSDSLVSVTQVSNTLGKAWTTANTVGQDAKVAVNGSIATSNGLRLSVRTATLDLDLTLSSTFADGPLNGTTTFNITGGGANFMIGQTISLGNTASLGFQSVATGKLGRGDTGYLATLATGGTNALSTKNFSQAQRVLDAAIQQVSGMRGRFGAFQKNTLGTTMNSLGVALENTMAAESAIRDADFAVETASMTRAQILVQAGTSALQMANSAPQSILALLR